ncbi:MAG: Flp pilus assembly complex ATPase component TadA [Treponema sp.]|nr:Flp pilus assembly complex ATPase component TadA [Treponema sp.]
MSALHTNDAVSSIPRLINMGIEPYLIASVLRGVMAQRLVRKICPYCKETAAISAEEARLLERVGIKGAPLYRGAGCSVCDHTGFRGRTSSGKGCGISWRRDYGKRRKALPPLPKPSGKR